MHSDQDRRDADAHRPADTAAPVSALVDVLEAGGGSSGRRHARRTLVRARDGADLAARVVDAVRAARRDGGTVAVIVPAGSVDEARAILQGPATPAGQGAAGSGDDPAHGETDPTPAVIGDRDRDVSTFDHAVVVEPSYIVGDDGTRGLRRLYAALNRGTRTVTICHLDDLPAGLASWAAAT